MVATESVVVLEVWWTPCMIPVLNLQLVHKSKTSVEDESPVYHWTTRAMQDQAMSCPRYKFLVAGRRLETSGKFCSSDATNRFHFDWIEEWLTELERLAYSPNFDQFFVYLHSLRVETQPELVAQGWAWLLDSRMHFQSLPPPIHFSVPPISPWSDWAFALESLASLLEHVDERDAPALLRAR